MAKHRKKYVFLRDSLFATILIFLFVWMVDLLLINVHAFNPMHLAITDFDLMDIGYSKFEINKHEAKDANVVIVNIGNDGRGEIARKINVLKKFNPKVIALDVVFEQKNRLESNAQDDEALKDAIDQTPNLVTGTYLKYNDKSGKSDDDSLMSSDPYFHLTEREGYMNLIGNREYNTIRYFVPKIEGPDKTLLSFTSKIIEKYDNTLFHKLMRRRYSPEVIRYRGGINDYTLYDSADIYYNNQNLQYLKGKIILMGRYNTTQHNMDFTDKHFTPLNENYVGRSLPDMYGVIIHANILSMILDDTYVSAISRDWMLVISFSLCFAHIMLFHYLFVKHHYWYIGFANVAVLISTLAIFLFCLFFYFRAYIKIDATLLIIPVAIGAEMVNYYEMLVKFLHRKFKFESYLASHAHH